MNRRPALLAVAALTTAAALSLSACGGGDGDSKSDDKIEGAGSTASEKPSPTASDDGIDRPEIELPGSRAASMSASVAAFVYQRSLPGTTSVRV